MVETDAKGVDWQKIVAGRKNRVKKLKKRNYAGAKLLHLLENVPFLDPKADCLSLNCVETED